MALRGAIARMRAGGPQLFHRTGAQTRSRSNPYTVEDGVSAAVTLTACSTMQGMIAMLDHERHMTTCSQQDPVSLVVRGSRAATSGYSRSTCREVTHGQRLRPLGGEGTSADQPRRRRFFFFISEDCDVSHAVAMTSKRSTRKQASWRLQECYENQDRYRTRRSRYDLRVEPNLEGA